MSSLQDIFSQVASLASAAVEVATKIAALDTEQEIRHVQAQFLKQGSFSGAMRALSGLSAEDRKKAGQQINQAKQLVQDAVASRIEALAERRRRGDLERSLDVTWPGRGAPRGHIHVLTQVRNLAVSIFAELGFTVAEGPQVETDFHNFEALAMPKDHPARDMQDTFYISDDVILRTHTSPVQIRTMLKHSPPIKIIAPGVVYRKDDDPTHSPMFSQIEGLLVDENVRFSDLKGVLAHFASRFFERDLAVRFRPSYFPFVEPGAEVDMQCAFCGGTGVSCRICKGTGWVEIAGAGMVDPEVFGHVKYDSERWTGFAFGMGIERMAMLRHSINDIKYYYEGDVRFLEQF